MYQLHSTKSNFLITTFEIINEMPQGIRGFVKGNTFASDRRKAQAKMKQQRRSAALKAVKVRNQNWRDSEAREDETREPSAHTASTDPVEHYSLRKSTLRRKLKGFKKINAETGDIEYECGVCNEIFKKYSNLKIHFHRHTKDGKYKCSFCPKRFPLRSSLNRHLTTHTGERRYFCKLCQQRFSRMDNCKTHEIKYCKNRSNRK